MAKATATKPRMYSIQHVATRWGRERRTIIRAIESGKLRAVRLSNRGAYMIPATEVQRVERGE